MPPIDPYTLLFALLGGLCPALIWLSFWLQEDIHPEPKRMIMLTFLAGTIAVPIAFFAEKIIFSILGNGFTVVVLWASIEEMLKYGAAFVIAFHAISMDKNKYIDEPVDPLIYMITAALGFAALENALFLINPLLGGDTLSGILTGNLRFIGASLLHVLASGTVGLALGLSFYKSHVVKRVYWGVGITLAVALHVLFNFSIILYKGENIFFIFGVLWILVGALLLLFEKIKRIKPF